jgi:uncharacterized membrane protein YphA (DoxX/SURF4 family)
MKAAVNIARILVGLLFIFSGLVKANDPLGLSYKMQEFFEVWGIGTKFNSSTLLMSVLMNAFEIIAGFALLIGWRIRLFSWLLLLLIIAFTFLTGYTFITGKPTNCGCFGDCLLISSKTSFLKDVALTILIGFLLWKRKLIKPIMGEKVAMITMFGITVFAFGFQWYTLNYLPVVDCLPFKKGKNISKQMEIPADAIPEVRVVNYVYEKDGKQIKFTADKFPAGFDSTYKFISRSDDVIKEGKNNKPRITGFVLKGVTDEDSTQIILSQPYAILLFSIDFSTPVSKWEKGFGELYAAAKAKSIPVYMISGRPGETPEKVKGTSFSDIQILKCDFTTIRTAARTNPCLYLLKQGTIEGKWSYKKMSSVISTVNQLPASGK